MVKVTVYITCYNYEEYVKKAIDSVLAQNFDDYELLIFRSEEHTSELQSH